jgi:hypothetical protein
LRIAWVSRASELRNKDLRKHRSKIDIQSSHQFKKDLSDKARNFKVFRRNSKESLANSEDQVNIYKKYDGIGGERRAFVVLNLRKEDFLHKNVASCGRIRLLLGYSRARSVAGGKNKDGNVDNLRCMYGSALWKDSLAQG